MSHAAIEAATATLSCSLCLRSTQSNAADDTHSVVWSRQARKLVLLLYARFERIASNVNLYYCRWIQFKRSATSFVGAPKIIHRYWRCQILCANERSMSLYTDGSGLPPIYSVYRRSLSALWTSLALLRLLHQQSRVHPHGMPSSSNNVHAQPRTRDT